MISCAGRSWDRTKQQDVAMELNPDEMMPGLKKTSFLAEGGQKRNICSKQQVVKTKARMENGKRG